MVSSVITHKYTYNRYLPHSNCTVLYGGACAHMHACERVNIDIGGGLAHYGHGLETLMKLSFYLFIAYCL